LELGHRQSRDSELEKTTGIPRLQTLQRTFSKEVLWSGGLTADMRLLIKEHRTNTGTLSNFDVALTPTVKALTDK